MANGGPFHSQSGQDPLLYNPPHDSSHDEPSRPDSTPYQQQLFRELDLMRQPLDFEDDYEFELNYDQIPEYDVREKLQTLNAQLASESLPPDQEHRITKVVFKDEIVSLVAPPVEYDLSESEAEDISMSNEPFSPRATLPKEPEAFLSPNTVTISNLSENTSNKDEITKVEDAPALVEEKDDISGTIGNEEVIPENKENEDIVVSRGGTFELLDSKEIIGEANRPTSSKIDRVSTGENIKHTKKKQSSVQFNKINKRDNGVNIDCGSSTQSDSNSRSNSQLQKLGPGVPRIDKEALRRQQERKQKEEEEIIRQEEEKQNSRREMNDKSYQAWLQIKQKQKREDDDKRKKEEEEENERKEKELETKKILAQEKEHELSKKMEHEKRKDEKLRQYRLKEIENATIVHSDSDCRKAFKDWLNKKHDEQKKKVKEEEQNARITRLAMRQCRKSQNLAQAIQQSSSFHYPDFYEYP